VPRSPGNKNTPQKIRDFVRILAPHDKKKREKMLFKYREGGRTVGSGRVATVIE
jgi:translation elongation factor EF-Tu-like GTPase